MGRGIRDSRRATKIEGFLLRTYYFVTGQDGEGNDLISRFKTDGVAVYGFAGKALRRLPTGSRDANRVLSAFEFEKQERAMADGTWNVGRPRRVPPEGWRR